MLSRSVDSLVLLLGLVAWLAGLGQLLNQVLLSLGQLEAAEAPDAGYSDVLVADDGKY